MGIIASLHWTRRNHVINLLHIENALIKEGRKEGNKIIVIYYLKGHLTEFIGVAHDIFLVRRLCK